jgi:hypothetical protein
MDTFSPNTIESRLALLSVYSDAPVHVGERAEVVLEQIRRELATLAPHVKTHLVTFQSDGLPDFYDVINLVVGALEKSGFACTGNDGKGKFGGVSMSGLWGIRVIRTPGIQAAKAEKDPRHHYSLLWPGSDLMDELTACTVYTPDPLYTPDGLITRAAACIQKIISHIRSQGALEKFIFADIEPDGHEMFSDVTLLVTRMLADAEFACVEACHADGTYSIITPKGDGECKRVKLTRVSK